MKIKKSNELLWLVGVFLTPLGVCLTMKSGFGLPIFAAPPYIIHHRLHHFHWLSHGLADLVFQAAMLILLVIVMKKFTKKFCYSFITTIIACAILDGWLFVFGGDGEFETLFARIAALVFGAIATSFSIACFYCTTLPEQVDEFFVEELSHKFRWKEFKVKISEDAVFFLLSLILAVVLNRSLHGLGIGTAMIYLVNEPLIRFFRHYLTKYFGHEPLFPKISHELSRE